MLNIKTIKKLLMLAVALVMLFTAAFFCCNTNLAALAQGEPTAEEVDDYLRDNGYSEEFIAMTGEQIKLRLYQENAVFQSSELIPINRSTRPMSEEAENYGGGEKRFEGEGEFDGLSMIFTISDVSDEQEELSVKYLTLSWNWDSEYSLDSDAIGFVWDTEYEAQEESALYEVYGTGYKISETITNPSIPSLPQACTGTFMTITGLDAITHSSQQIDKGRYTERKEGVGYQYVVDTNKTITRQYASGSEATYQLDPNLVTCSYAIKIQKYINPNHNSISGVVANYFLWKNAIDFEAYTRTSTEFTFNPLTFEVGVKVTFEAYFSTTTHTVYDVSDDLYISFNNYNKPVSYA